MIELIIVALVNLIFLLVNRKKVKLMWLHWISINVNILVFFLIYYFASELDSTLLQYLSGGFFVLILFSQFPKFRQLRFSLPMDMQFNIILLYLWLSYKVSPSLNKMEKAIVYLNLSKRYQLAIGLCNKYLKESDNLKVMGHKTYSLINIGEYNKANTELDKILKTNHSDNYYITLKADVLYKLKDYDNAALYYHKAIQQKPNTPELWFSLARTYQKLNRFDDCEQTFKKVLDRNRSYLPAYTALAKLYINNNLYDKAREVLEQALDKIKHPHYRIHINKMLMEIKNKDNTQ
ncbi:tetratricopeptide repeat protein [Proteinivorax hydrogeniformans]|uniref:Tetratricopeptide repeat protein n=1 Tax=Proteinivorax hydrogeniformans TaxID=1826727 RepID=A0AAU8HVT9_9FIRM